MSPCASVSLVKPLILVEIKVRVEADFNGLFECIPLDRAVVCQVFTIDFKGLCPEFSWWPPHLLALKPDDQLLASEVCPLVVIDLQAFFILPHDADDT